MSDPPQHIGKIALFYSVGAFSTISYFTLRFEQARDGISWGHTLAYWFINALLILGVWFFINWEKGPWGIFAYHPALRKVAGGIAFLVAILVADVGFYRMLEGQVPPHPNIWIFVIVLVVIALYTGLVCTRVRPIAEYDATDQAHARGLRNVGMPLGGTALLACVTAYFTNDRAAAFFETIWADFNLRVALLLVVICTATSLVLAPWLIEQEIEGKKTKREEKTRNIFFPLA